MSVDQRTTTTSDHARPGDPAHWVAAYHHAIAQGDDATAGRALAELRRHGVQLAALPVEASPCPDC